MVDKESHEIMTEPGGAPAKDGGAPDETLKEHAPFPAAEPVEGASADEATPAESRAPEPAVAQSPAPSLPPPRPAQAPKAPGAGRALAGGVIGGAIVAALAAGYFTQFPPKVQIPESDLSRIAALEKAVSHDNEVAAGLDRRIGALEAANAAEASKIDAGVRAIQAVSGEIPALAGRLDKLEKGVPDLSALTGKVQKLETDAAAPRPPEAGASPAALAILAETIRDRLASGASYATELSALEGLGVDPAKLAALKPLAGGAPTSSALAAAFQAAEPKLLAAIAPKEGSSVADRLLAHVRSLVQIRDVGEVQGDDPQAVASQVLADLKRGDLAGALAAFAKLPEPAREAAAAVAAQAKTKLDAVVAAQSIRDAAVARLAEIKP